MKKESKTMSHYVAKMRKENELGELADSFVTKKLEDIAELINSDLPHFEFFETPYSKFTEKNKPLMSFLKKHIALGDGFCIRAIPQEEGAKKELTRKSKYGYLNFKSCLKFLNGIKEKRFNPKLWEVLLNNWRPTEYAGIIIASNNLKIIRGEIAKNLNKLTHGDEQPLASFELERGGFLSISNRVKWRVKDKGAQELLWNTFLRYIILGHEDYTPIVKKGYYEVVFIKGNRGEFEAKFLDWKTNPMYLK